MKIKRFGLLIFVVCSSVCAGCSSTQPNANTAANTSAPAANSATLNTNQGSTSTASSTAYPQDTRDAFLRSCESAGSTTVFCTCVFDKIQQKYPYEEFKAMEEAMLDGKTPTEFIKFSEQTRTECGK